MDLESKIQNYTITPEAKQRVVDTPVVLVAGIVCAGKDTVIRTLTENSKYQPIISYTTRAPRANHGVMERNGHEYYFIDQKEAERMIDAGEFIEVKYVHGNVYGSAATELETAQLRSKIAITDIDIQGVKEYMAIKPDVKAIFLLPPSVDTWMRRLEKRYGTFNIDSPDIKARLKTAYTEISEAMTDDRFVVIINDDLETTVERINQVVTGEKDHTSDFADSIAGHIKDFLSHHI